MTTYYRSTSGEASLEEPLTLRHVFDNIYDVADESGSTLLRARIVRGVAYRVFGSSDQQYKVAAEALYEQLQEFDRNSIANYL